jgi:hypothetical protein
VFCVLKVLNSWCRIVADIRRLVGTFSMLLCNSVNFAEVKTLLRKFFIYATTGVAEKYPEIFFVIHMSRGGGRSV